MMRRSGRSTLAQRTLTTSDTAGLDENARLLLKE